MSHNHHKADKKYQCKYQIVNILSKTRSDQIKSYPVIFFRFSKIHKVIV